MTSELSTPKVPTAAPLDVVVGHAQNLEGSLAHGVSKAKSKKTRAFMIATLISHISQIGREVVSAFLFGISAQMSAFTLAFQLPHLVRALVADSALSAAFVPTFIELKDQGEETRAWQLASTVAAAMMLVLIPLTAVALYFAPQIVSLFADPGFSQMHLAVSLFRILFPIIIVMSLGGLVIGILNAHGQFTVGAIAPVAWNVMIIIGLAISSFTVAPHNQIWAYAIAVAVGTVIQAFIPVPWLRKAGAHLTTKFIFQDPAVRQMFALMLPVSLCLGLINFNLLIDIHYATRIGGAAGEHGPAALDKALRLYMIPLGTIAVGITTVAFAKLVEAARTGRGSKQGQADFATALATSTRRMLISLSLPAVLVPVLALPIVRLIYERGAFSNAQAHIVAGVLTWFSVGLLVNGLGLLSTRALFALKRNWLPTAVAAGNLALNIVFDSLLYVHHGLVGIALATSICNALSWAALCVCVRADLKSSQWTSAWSVGVRTISCAVVSAALAWSVMLLCTHLWGDGLLVNGLALIAATSLAALCYRELLGLVRLEKLTLTPWRKAQVSEPSSR